MAVSRCAAVGRLGIGVCYDIRFPELAQLYAKRGAQLLVYPGAFNMTTVRSPPSPLGPVEHMPIVMFLPTCPQGPLHWQLLAQARAVDNQVFMALCSPARDESAGYVAWGHSTLVGPVSECKRMAPATRLGRPGHC